MVAGKVCKIWTWFARRSALLHLLDHSGRCEIILKTSNEKGIFGDTLMDFERRSRWKYACMADLGEAGMFGLSVYTHSMAGGVNADFGD